MSSKKEREFFAPAELINDLEELDRMEKVANFVIERSRFLRIVKWGVKLKHKVLVDRRKFWDQIYDLHPSIAKKQCSVNYRTRLISIIEE